MRRQAGFTLLELLIAITLLGLLMAAMFGGLRLGVRAWEVADERLEANARVEVVQHFLRERLTQIRPMADDAGRRRRLLFRGQPDELSFVTLLSDRLGIGLVVMSLRVGEDDARPLELRWRPVAVAAEERSGAETIETHTLLEGVERLEMLYYGRFEAGAPSAWREQWLDAAVLPKLILVRVVFARGDGRVWPDLVVQPMIEGMPAAF